MKIDAWWFENQQNIEDIIDPKWFKPRTHFAVFLESNEILFPIKLLVCAKKSGKELFSSEYQIDGLEDKLDYEIMKRGNAVLFKGFADEVYGLPDQLQLQINTPKQVYQKNIPLSYATIRGRATDFQGAPFPTAVVFQRKFFGGKTPCIGVWSNQSGEYSVTIPMGEYDSFYVDDSSYKISTLENWSWKMLVDCDETHDFKIGNGEVYNLSVVEEPTALLLNFRPMILPSIKRVESSIFIDNEQYTLVDIQPDIEKQDVSVLINGKSVLVLTVERDFEKIMDDNRKIALINYKIKVKKPKTIGRKALVVVEYQTKGRYEVCGQGRTYFYPLRKKLVNSYGE